MPLDDPSDVSAEPHSLARQGIGPTSNHCRFACQEESQCVLGSPVQLFTLSALTAVFQMIFWWYFIQELLRELS